MEQEVLIQEGIKFKIIKVEQKAVTIKVDGKQGKKKLTIVKLENVEEKYNRMN